MTKIEKLVKDYGITEGCYLQVGNGVIVYVDKIFKTRIRVHEIMLGIKNCEVSQNQNKKCVKVTYYPIRDSIVEDGIQIYRVGPGQTFEDRYWIRNMRIVHDGYAYSESFEVRIDTDDEKNIFYEDGSIYEVISADDIDRYTFEGNFRYRETINNIWEDEMFDKAVELSKEA